jgi:predicted esterase
MRSFIRVSIAVLAVALIASCATRSSRDGGARPASQWWSPRTQQAIENGGTNRTELLRALQRVPELQRAAMEFLIENMPERDAKTLHSDYLLTNVALAQEALAKAPWHDRIPADIYLNDVLPYACMNERRDDWREKLREVSLPLVADCKTPGEAAQRLNQKLFPLLKVRYSTERKRADQCPTESIASGIATCTGLSILLVDACRSVGVPARVVGTPMWSNMRGNHTWVEVWDGHWHFTGAAEPDKKGLDRGWFVHDASQAKKEVPQHAIYATSFKQTGLSFPLVWAPGITWVAAVNVTDHYAPKSTPATNNEVRLLVKVLDAPAGKRVAAAVTVTDTNAGTVLKSVTKDESADLNDILAFSVTRGRNLVIGAARGNQFVRREIVVSTNAQELVTLMLSDTPSFLLPSMACYAPPPILSPLKTDEAMPLASALKEFFAATPDRQTNWQFAPSLEKLLRENEPAVRQAAWEAYRAAPIHGALKQDFDTNQVRFEKRLSPYTVKTVGPRPTNGWALFIAMHGGGGAPKQVNDSQWKVMQSYYRDHPEAGGYIYVALRAPNDTWNGFYDVYVYPLIANLIEQFTLFGDVDVNKAFIMGYSHGGYGAYAIGPKMPDRFAAIHASAAAATDGESTAKTLRNTIFTVMVGEKDTMYGRYERNKKFAAEIETLRGNRNDIYPVHVEIKEGFGHGGLPDRDKIKLMYPAVRNPVPRELTWLLTDKVITDFFWLHVPEPTKKQEIWASCHDNRFVVTANSNVTAVTVFFDNRLVDFSKPVDIELNGSTTSRRVEPRLRTLCETLLPRGDIELAFTGRLDIRKNENETLAVVNK